MIQLRTINKILAEDGYPLELVKGDGYFYFDFAAYDRYDGRLVYETESVYVYRLNDLTLERWLEIGRQFAIEVEHKNGLYFGPHPTYLKEMAT